MRLGDSGNEQYATVSAGLITLRVGGLADRGEVVKHWLCQLVIFSAHSPG